MMRVELICRDTDPSPDMQMRRSTELKLRNQPTIRLNLSTAGKPSPVTFRQTSNIPRPRRRPDLSQSPRVSSPSIFKILHSAVRRRTHSHPETTSRERNRGDGVTKRKMSNSVWGSNDVYKQELETQGSKKGRSSVRMLNELVICSGVSQRGCHDWL